MAEQLRVSICSFTQPWGRMALYLKAQAWVPGAPVGPNAALVDYRICLPRGKQQALKLAEKGKTRTDG